MNKTPPIAVGILVVSDRAFQGKYQDLCAQEIKKTLFACIQNPIKIFSDVIADSQKLIESKIKAFCDKKHCGLVITAGGTGPAKRDVTPEATARVCKKILPGLAEAMRLASVEKVPTAMLSRQIAGIRGKSLVINLPGNPKAAQTCLEAIFPAIPDCLDLIGAPKMTTTNKIKAYRHKK